VKFEVRGNPFAGKTGMLLHSLCLDPAQFDAVAELLQDEYALILPSFDGHYAERQTRYQALDDQVDQIMGWLEAKGIRELDFVCGVSLGALAAFELYKRKRLRARAWYFDGGPFFDFGPVRIAWQTFLFCAMEFFVRRCRWLAMPIAIKRYGAELAKNAARMSCIVTFGDIAAMMRTGFSLDIPKPLADDETRLVFIYGSKEEAFRSFRRFHGQRGIELIVKEGFGHCQFLARQPEAYAEMLRGNCVSGLGGQDDGEDRIAR
jgi:pimeloyl-ACP methyl ester carboxylesterase